MASFLRRCVVFGAGAAAGSTLGPSVVAFCAPSATATPTTGTPPILPPHYITPFTPMDRNSRVFMDIAVEDTGSSSLPASLSFLSSLFGGKKKDKEESADDAAIKGESQFNLPPGILPPPPGGLVAPRAPPSGYKTLGRIQFELFDDIVPITARNFRLLCKGDQGVSPEGIPLAYKGSPFHRIIPEFMAQGGDFTQFNGRGGCSIYGARFKDESFSGKAGKHTAPGLLSMANAGAHTNGSQFFITFQRAPWLDGKHVVFGQVEKGFEVVKAMEKLGTANGTPKCKVMVFNCGVVKEMNVMVDPNFK